MSSGRFVWLLFFAPLVLGKLDELLEGLDRSCLFKISKRHNVQNLQCLSENSSKLGPNDIPTFADNGCFCDARCFDYGDCCLDISHPKDSDWSCRRVPSAEVYVFMKQTCRPDWVDDGIKQFCEEEAEYLWKGNRPYHHLQKIPTYSMSTKTLYRNVFCAICNQDNGSLKRLNTTVECDRKQPVNGRLESKAIYLPEENKWVMNTTNGAIKCWIEVKEMSSLGDITRLYNGRRCKGVSTCSPSWTNSEDRIQCSQDDGVTQFIYFHHYWYKNPYCARCNNISESVLSCNINFSSFSDELSKGLAWYPLLLDFNFDDSKNTCGKDELYDPVLQACLSLSCGQTYQKIGDKCVLKGNQTDEVGKSKYNCFKVVLGKELFVMLENNVIYVNHTGRMYSKEEYEPVLANGVLKEVLICAEEVVDFNFSTVQYWMSEIGLMISMCCLLIHLIVYLILPKMRNLPGKILMCLSVSLLVGQASFLLGAHGGRQGVWYCRITAVITHLSHLAAFFWMNVMALDVCRTFCSSRPRSERSRSFLKYSLYAWIMPIAITAAALGLDFTCSHSLYAPRYGRNVCWISQRRGILIFFVLPLAALLLANIIMFFLTAMSLNKTARQTKIACNFSEKVRFVLYVKIALILGLTWIFGFLATLTKQEYLWYPFILFNTLQGAFIFLCFTMKRKVWNLLKETFGAKKGGRKGLAAYGKQHTSTSNLSTLQTSLTTSLSASVPVLCNQKDIVQAIVKGNFQTLKK